MKMSFGIFYLVSQSDAGLQGVQNKQKRFYLLYAFILSFFFQPWMII